MNLPFFGTNKLDDDSKENLVKNLEDSRCQKSSCEADLRSLRRSYYVNALTIELVLTLYCY